jgi:hypothetical protein
LTTVAAIHNLTPQEAARGFPVKLHGVISYTTPDASLMFVQDETGGTYVQPRLLPRQLRELPIGTVVDVEGVTVPGLFAPFVAGAGGRPVVLTAHGQSAMPEPLRVTRDQLADPQNRVHNRSRQCAADCDHLWQSGPG